MTTRRREPSGEVSLPEASSSGLGAIKRKAVPVSEEGLVKAGRLGPEAPLPMLVQPAIPGVDLTAWAPRNRKRLKSDLAKSGGILFRNFDSGTVERFEQFILAVSGEMLEYNYGSTPRSHVSGRIYTSTEYPASQTIPLHNEMSYAGEWPMKIWFLCLETAAEGGETPIADSRKVFERLDPEVREKFARKKVMYVRNYRDGLDVPWPKVFGTSDRSKVEEYCRSAGIEWEWVNGAQLRTREVRQAVARHPETGETVWFNQTHLFHVSNLPPEGREILLSTFREEDLPRNAYYGDGSSIEASSLEAIREAYREEAVTFPWQRGDILMLDNMLTAHGRRPFAGSRRVVVGMAESSRGAAD